MNIWLGYIRDQHPKASLRNLIYEDLAALEQDELDEAITGILATCDIPKTGQVVARTRKIIKDWRQKVSNADEIEAVYSGRA